MALAKPSTPNNVLLGYGIVTVDSAPVGLTRGGSVFTVEREIRNIAADGDRGPVKGRISIDTEIGKLTVKALEIFSAEDIKLYYPATTLTAGVWKGKKTIDPTDYHTVVFTGKTLAGETVSIKVENAINLSNLEWTLEDKNEVVPSIEFTATYSEEDRETPPWSVTFPTGV